MNTKNCKIDEWIGNVQSISRVAIGILFLMHGTSKLFGVPAPLHPMGEFQLFSLIGIAGVLEVVGGFLFVLGFHTRITAFILSGMMAVAYWMAHAPHGVLPYSNGGELAALYSFIFLFYAFAGAGAWSVDQLCDSRKGCQKSG